VNIHESIDKTDTCALPQFAFPEVDSPRGWTCAHGFVVPEVTSPTRTSSAPLLSVQEMVPSVDLVDKVDEFISVAIKLPGIVNNAGRVEMCSWRPSSSSYGGGSCSCIQYGGGLDEYCLCISFKSAANKFKTELTERPTDRQTGIYTDGRTDTRSHGLIVM
jgi:hypothetical protein